MRVKNSLGAVFINEGTSTEYKEERYELDKSRKFYLFDVIPIGAPRMTQSDRWKTNPSHIDPKKRQRACVTQYFESKNKLIQQAEKMDFSLGDWLECVFLIPMPDSWSMKKKEKMNGMPCKSKPDTDNLLKFLCDSLVKNDQTIWKMDATKVWAFKGSIIVFK